MLLGYLLEEEAFCVARLGKFLDPLFFTIIRCDFDGRVGCWIGNEKGRWNKLAAASTTAPKKRRLSISPLASSALAETPYTSRAEFYQEVGIIISCDMPSLFNVFMLLKSPDLVLLV